MKNNNKSLNGNKTTASTIHMGIDPGVIIKILLKRWYVFVFFMVLSFVAARYYIGHTMPVYRVATSVLIFEDEGNSGSDNDELLKGLGLPGGMRNLENQIKILASRELTERALKRLRFEEDFYYKTVRNDISLYPNSPIKLVYEGKNPLPRNVEFHVEYLGNNDFRLFSEVQNINITSSFGKIIKFPDGNFRIDCINKQWFREFEGYNVSFVVRSLDRLVKYFNGRMSVNVLTRSGSILEISISGTNQTQDVDFLNELTAVFQDISLEKKNMEANRRIQFIDNQLVGIRDSLVLTENQLSQFRSSNRVMDLSAQGQAIITQVTRLENEKARLRLEANYYDYLADYLEKDAVGELPMVPISMGIEDPGLNNLVSELGSLQEQMSGEGGGEKNPLQSLLNQRVAKRKAELLETLNGLQRANKLAMQENNDRIAKINSQAAALPVTERQMLGIERKFKLNDELYTFLLQKMSELQMQKASNRPDNEVVDPASVMYSQMIAPNSTMIYFIAIFLGGVIPMLFFYLFFALNNRVREEDITRFGDLPIMGSIPHIKGNSFTEIFDNPESVVAEAYRLVRSKLQFVTKETKNPLILVTSAMPGDGKTLTSINLSAVYSLLGKNTVLVGFDLRNPKFANAFDLNNEVGVSTFLIGKHSVDEIIQETFHSNLSVISSGPVPPNPSELAASSKTQVLFEKLKERFDYIIVDSAPIGLISDTHHLTTHVDTVLMVARINKTLKDMMGHALQECMASNEHVSLLINDSNANNKKYGYGKKYGYINGQTKRKKK
ncbi:GumC family protein [Saccharicrinis fermentans]|uniref:non-specific protein-tyrosine kinase n=1 Tax=Saccharicrinis fermentans DSM 9555 = JCM 21142 TaxID=869213 RepID=W7YFL1_9BACT|nr:tyrosine-protein kinase [Saccharicrinis fermentans]GAF03236.1 tyrosine-protein kinase ptk [Saccharicrinis fermentans DSM 9555 = JCM 21142]